MGKRFGIKAGLCVLALQMLLITGCAGKEKAVIYDDAGNELATLHSTEIKNSNLKEEAYRSYVEIAFAEAIERIVAMRDCTEEEAIQEIFTGQYQIHTAFQKDVFQSVKSIYDQQEQQSAGEACAITDLKGNLIMTYSVTDSEEYVNNASIKRTPYATFAPLTVYAPAIDARVINWSSVHGEEDQKIMVVDAIAQSEDAHAQTILMDCDVQNSIDFLKFAFQMSLEEEETGLRAENKEKTMKNIAAGYIQEGASPIDMAGYYQIFANGGVYIKPGTVVKICDKNGEIVYNRKTEENQVLRTDTAKIMNQLLQNAADIEISNVGGKAGKGEGGDWYVGFTTEYSCAIWHGGKNRDIFSKEIFSQIIPEIITGDVKDYPECRTVFEAAYCSESGMFLSDKCRMINRGFYALDDVTAVCNIH